MTDNLLAPPKARPNLAITDSTVAVWRETLREHPDEWVAVVTDFLTRDVPEESLSRREGPSKMILTYVDGAYAIATRAFLSRLGIASDLDVLQTDVSAESVDCLVRFTMKWGDETMSSTQWGECYRRAGMALGDVKKGAVTDGFKKCLSEFGWAWNAYNAEPVVYTPPSPEEMHNQAIETIYSIGSGKGMTRSEVDLYVKEKTGLTLEEMKPVDLTSIKRKLQKETADAH